MAEPAVLPPPTTFACVLLDENGTLKDWTVGGASDQAQAVTIAIHMAAHYSGTEQGVAVVDTTTDTVVAVIGGLWARA